MKKVRLNNGIRSKILAAVGGLDLVSPDRAKRLAAAATAFHAPDPKTLPAMNLALGKESDPAVKDALIQAHAAIVAVSGAGTEQERLDAIATLKVRGDGDALNLVNQTAAAPDASPAVKAAAASAASSIQWMLNLWQALQNAWYGLSLGSVLLLAAIGLAITFGVMGIINMAHGEMVMIGAYTTYVVQQALATTALGSASLLIAVPLAFLVAGGIGVGIERLIIRHLYGPPPRDAARHLGRVADPAAARPHGLRRR